MCLLNMKRKRSYNFEQSENNLLIDLCLDHKDVIENTETSDEAVLSETWMKIMNIFNERSGKHPRTVEALQTKHEDNKEYYKQYAEHEQKLLAIFNNSSLEPVVDSDMQFKQLVVETTYEENEHSDISEEITDSKPLGNSFIEMKDSTIESDEETSNPANVLQTSESNEPGKSCNVPEPNGDRQGHSSDRKSELVALQIEIMKQELLSKENDEKRKRELHKYDLLLIQQRIENEQNDARRRSELQGLQLEKEKLELLLF